MPEHSGSDTPKDAATHPAGSPLNSVKKTGEAVQTPPPETSPAMPTAIAFDAEAPTIIDIHAGANAPTMMVPPRGGSDAPKIMVPPDAGSDAPTMFAPPIASQLATGAGSPTARRSRIQTPSMAPETAEWVPDRLEIGTILANRYEIVEVLGEGGMGAVYKARDTELDRIIALKVIRPELAKNPEILQRFKQELILARQVTDRNIIRIFDLGEADGIRFITMEYVQGNSLHQILRDRGKIAVGEAVEIMKQVLQGLRAAHREGVVHRDLKPGNIMRDGTGRILVMDFGLARSLQSDGMTQTGAVLGTMDYMSPEQAKGEEVDQRSDLYTVGLIFFEILTGKMPFKADSALASLWKRMQERAIAVSQVDSTIPVPIANIVARCLERDPQGRYQSAQEALDEIERWQGNAPVSTLSTIYVPRLRVWWLRLPRPVLASAVLLVLLAISGFIFRDKIFRKTPKAVGPQVALAILPFRNASGDASLDWMGKSLAEILRTDVGQSESCRIVPPERLHQILTDLRISADTELDVNTIRRIAEFTSADQVVWGQYVRLGDEIRIDATLEDLKAERSVPIKGEAANEKALLNTVDQLAKSIQDKLSLSSKAVGEMKAASFKPSSSSIDALRDYSLGLELSRQANPLEAAKKFESATKEDPNFALAFAQLGQTYATLGYEKQAKEYSSRAIELADNLPSAEKYLIQATNARIQNNYDKAIDAYENLARLMPADPEVQYEIGSLYESHGAFDQARDHYQRALATDPKYLEALLAIGTVEFKRGNPQGSLDYLNRALSLAVELNNQQGKANVLQAIGDAYMLLNKPTDALQNCQQSFEIKKQIGDKKGMATSLDEMAQIYEAIGKPKDAEKAYRDALQLDKDIGNQGDAGITSMNLGDLLQNEGRYAEALDLTKQALQIETLIGDENVQTICLNNIGNIYFNQGLYQEALTYFQQALSLGEKLKVPSNLAMTLNNVGEAFRKLGRYDQAMTNYLRGLEVSRGAGDKLGVAEISSGMASLFEVQGRYGAALSAEEDAFKNIQDNQDANKADIELDYANALILIGRGDDAQKNLDESLTLAKSLQNSSLISKALNLQGDRLFYRGDLKGAKPLYEQAQQSAKQANDRNQGLIAKFNLAKLAAKEGQSTAATASLRSLSKDADALGEKYISAQISLYLGDCLLQAKKYPAAQDQLENALRGAQSAGMKSLQPQAEFWLAAALAGQGKKAEAATHMQTAQQLLEDMHREAHTDALLQRDDFRLIAQPAHN